MDYSSYVGRDFTIKGYPVAYRITDYLIDIFNVQAHGVYGTLSIDINDFEKGLETGQIRMVGESTPIVEAPKEEPKQEPEQTNYFSFDDL